MLYAVIYRVERRENATSITTSERGKRTIKNVFIFAALEVATKLFLSLSNGATCISVEPAASSLRRTTSTHTRATMTKKSSQMSAKYQASMNFTYEVLGMLWLVCVKKAASTSRDVRDTMMRSWNTEPLVDAAWGPLDDRFNEPRCPSLL